LIVLFNQQIFVKTAVINTNDLQNETTTENVPFEETTAVAEITSLVPVETDEEIDTSVPISDDVIELNVGGQKMTTLRSTLTVIPNSKLARMFSKDNTETNLLMDKQGAVFFDYNPIYFNYLLDQLRAMKRMPKKPGYQVQFQAPYISSQLNFTHMLVDLGLTRKLNTLIFEKYLYLSYNDKIMDFFKDFFNLKPVIDRVKLLKAIHL
jgi:hypothetical protein